MDLNVLGLFASVARAGSYAAVARDRNIDPSSISRMISALEKEMGVRLFQRSTRQVKLTEAGDVFLGKIEPLLDEIRYASLSAADVSNQPRGVLKVTASNSFGLRCVVPVLPIMNQLYPDIMVDLQLSDQVADLLAEQFDIAIRLGALPDSNLAAQSLIKTSYVVCASPAYLKNAGQPQAPAEVSAHDCLLFPLQGFRTRWLFKDRKGKISEVPVKPRTVISNAMAIQHCVQHGMGIALLPTWLVEPDLATGALINLFPAHQVTATNFDSRVWCVFPTRSYVPTKVRVFIEQLRRYLDEKGLGSLR